MKTNVRRGIKLFAGLFISMCAFTACSEDDELLNELPSQEETKTCTMQFNGQIQTYEDEATTRSTTEWTNGNKVYLLLADGTVRGTAVYSASSKSWSFQYSGTLKKGEGQKCTAYYFENYKENNTNLSLDPNTVVYSASDAEYSYNEDGLTVTANLAPLTGRIRFKGEAGDTAFVSGVFSPYEFDLSAMDGVTGAWFQTLVVVGKDGYTPYVYGLLDSDNNRTMQITRWDNVFTRSFDNNVLASGKSGYMTLPSSTSSNGWSTYNPFFNLQWSSSATAVQKEAINTFLNSMVKVEGGSFMMGAQNTNPNQPNYDANANAVDGPVHQVVLPPYYMAKYEVTEELYGLVMNSSSYYQTPSYQSITFSNTYYNSMPDTYLSNFITTLNSLTGLTFDIPTEAEWEYAARGGRYSHGYTYAGSNTIGDVTYTSNGITNVGLYKANELGIYDMTGNAAELCYYLGTYPSTLVINPSTTTQYCARGGDSRDAYNGGSYSSYGRNSTRLRHYSSYVYTGLRLVLRLN